MNQSTRPHARVVTHRLGPGAPWFACLPVRLRDQAVHFFWTAFGPTNVALHKASTAVELGDPGEAVNMLLEAERLVPEAVRYQVIVKEMLRELLRREHRASTPQLRPLAVRVGILREDAS
jgi:hypothetical protein